MKLYIDDVRVEKLKELIDLYPVDGVTSNPSVLMRGGRPPVEVLKEIRSMIGLEKMLMAQVISTQAEDMIREAHRLLEILGASGENYFVKLPANPQGIKAIKALSAEGIRCNATGIYSVAQGLLAANAGALAMATYISRIDNLGGDGMKVTRDMQAILNAYPEYRAQIIPGSIKTVQQVVECAKAGIAGVAVSVDVWERFMQNACVDAAIDGFNQDFETLCGEERTFLDL